MTKIMGHAFWVAVVMTMGCGSDAQEERGSGGSAGATNRGGSAGSGGSSGSAGVGGTSGSTSGGGTGGTSNGGSGASGGGGASSGGSSNAGGAAGSSGSAGEGGEGNSGGSGGSAGEGGGTGCGELGEECSGVCSGGFECLEGVCIPSGRPICGGFAGAECPEGTPLCMYCASCDYGPCFRTDERACLCRTGAARAGFPGCSG